MAAARLTNLWLKVRRLPFGRILGVVVLSLLAVIVALTLFASQLIGRWPSDIRTKREADRNPPPATLPSAETLAEDEAFNGALVEFPERTNDLWTLRARALHGAGRWEDSLAAFQRAAVASVASRSIADELIYVEDLVQLRRFEQAIDQLGKIDLTSASEEERSAVVSALAYAHRAWKQRNLAPSDAEEGEKKGSQEAPESEGPENSQVTEPHADVH
jgi:hypothetical protein